MSEQHDNTKIGIKDISSSNSYCVTADTYLFTTKRGLVKIGTIVKHDPKQLQSGHQSQLEQYKYSTPSLNGKKRTISTLIYGGCRKVLAIETENAPDVKCTPNHLFLTVTPTGFDWVKAKKLTPEHYLCTPRMTCDSKRQSISEDEAEFMGLLIADGWVTKWCIGFCGTSKSVNDRYRDLVTKVLRVSPMEHVKVPEENHIAKKKCRYFEVNSKDLVSYITDKYDIPEGNSRMRYVPKFIFTQPKNIVAAFLKGYVEGNGGIYASLIIVSSSSKVLLSETQILLQGFFNIRSSVGFDRAEDETYKLTIAGRNNYLTFIREIGFISNKKKRIARKVLKTKFADTTASSRRDIIPHVYKTAKGYEVHKTLAKFMENYSEYKTSLQKKYEHHITGKYIYSKVVSVTPVGKEHVYNLMVPKSQAFTANGYIVHGKEE